MPPQLVTFFSPSLWNGAKQNSPPGAPTNHPSAGIQLSLAYHEREAILDGNLVRIFSRLYALDFLPTESKESSEAYWNYAREVADSPKAYMHNEALMELGRTVCKIKNPDCANCPLQESCRAAKENRTADFPPAKKHEASFVDDNRKNPEKE